MALWALGDPAGADVMAARPADPAAALAARRISGLLPASRTPRSAPLPLAGQALAEAARRLPAADWELLGAALTKILLHAGAPRSTCSRSATGSAIAAARVLTEELAQRVGGCGDDPRGDAERFVARRNLRTSRSACLAAALCAQGSAWSNSYRRFANWWPCDPLAFPPDADDDIPLAVFDQLAALPPGRRSSSDGSRSGWAPPWPQGDPAGLFENRRDHGRARQRQRSGRTQKLVELHLGMLSTHRRDLRRGLGASTPAW